MDKLKTFIKEHQKGALIALFLLIVFVGCSAVSAVNVAQHRAQEAAEQTEQAQKDDKGDTSSKEADVPLTDEQKKAIDNYDGDTKKFIDTLSASVWSTDGGKDTLRFSDNSYTETANGKTETHSYAILRLERGMDTAGSEVSTAVFETDTGTHVVTYTNLSGVKPDDSGKVSSSLSSNSMFTLKGSNYERKDSVEAISIKGLNSEIVKLLGDDTEKLTSELSKWCAVTYPTATEATWEKAVVIDYETGVVSTNFTLNIENPVSIAVTYNRSDGTYAFNI